MVEAGGIYRIQRERHCKIKVSEEHKYITHSHISVLLQSVLA